MLRWIVRLIAILVLTDSGWAATQFDVPLKSEVIATGPKSVLRCLTYPNFLLKWETDGAITPVIYILKGKGPWACAATMKGELNFGSWPMVRVKGPYIVLQYPPHAYGSSFTVFDTTRWRYAQADTAIADFTGARLDGSDLVLQFRRPVHMECSLYYGASTGCWGEVKAKSGLTDALMPDCRMAYEKQKKSLNVADITGYPATVTYNVEARIARGKVAYTPLPGPIVCEP